MNNEQIGGGRMKKLLLAITISAAACSASAQMATIDMANLYESIANDAVLVSQYTAQGLQYEAELKHLIANPSSIQSTNLNAMINQIGGIMSASQGMGGSLASVNSNYAKTFGNNTANTYSQNFTNWNNSSKATLQSAMQTAGLHRDQYATDSAAIAALYQQSQSTQGTLSALQTLAQIDIQMVQQLQALRDLLAAQHIAVSTELSTKVSKQQAIEDAHTKVWTLQDTPLSTPRATGTNHF